MLQAFAKLENKNKLPNLKSLYNIECTRKVLQWIPSHCGISGNEQVDKMAKMGAKDEQIDNPVSLTELKNNHKKYSQGP